MTYPRNDQDYLLSPDWSENGHRFDIRYRWDALEPQVVLVPPEGELEVIPLSEAVNRGIVSRKTAYHARAVSEVVRKAAQMTLRNPF
jgi:hypothetical protein